MREMTGLLARTLAAAERYDAMRDEILLALLVTGLDCDLAWDLAAWATPWALRRMGRA
jgi:hypothetical protein